MFVEAFAVTEMHTLKHDLFFFPIGSGGAGGLTSGACTLRLHVHAVIHNEVGPNAQTTTHTRLT